jgi:UDP-N-acetylmuramate: L-alanyl-gamma-D-glutamyl-meso-diaminopimelate ligase
LDKNTGREAGLTDTLNQVPARVRSIHLIAACGTAMGALACLLKQMGYAVTGSDANVYPPMSTYLKDNGIFLKEGFSPENVSHGPDLVVVGNAVKKDNPEAVRALEMGLCYCSMPQAVNHFLVGERKAILVAGTHGKTTTSAMIAWLLQYAGLDPAFIIGGFVKNFGGNFRLGGGAFVVLEADEYDTAFFDKRPKFMHYDPAVAVLTGVEFDHADIFKDISHVEQAFDAFVSGMDPDALLVASDHDSRIDRLLEGKAVSSERYGGLEGSAWRLESARSEQPWTRFAPSYKGAALGAFKASFYGAHNLQNALAALAVGHHLGVPAEVMAQAMETFSGVKRRQEVRGVKAGVTVIDDFAHHPTAVSETVRAVRAFYPGGRLIAVFEPRTNTSMRSVFQNVYPKAFDQADVICIRKPPLLSKIPPQERFSSGQLVEDLVARGKNALYFEETSPIVDFIASTAESGDIVLVMSNGGFDGIHERLLAVLPRGRAAS